MRSYLRPLLPLFVVLAGAYWVVLFTLTHVPSVRLPDITLIDKICHAIAYATLAFAIGSVLTIWRGYQPRFPIWIWTIAVSYGAIDEYTQQFVPNRTCDIFDLVADTLGATLGLLAVHLCVMFTRRQRCEAALVKVPVEA